MLELRVSGSLFPRSQMSLLYMKGELEFAEITTVWMTLAFKCCAVM